ncbi:MAG: M48 family metalloprotease, partial [Rhizobiales bacterium]|nr:M48 family metalloprotease [Hyphomicrobiales bacterium]
PDVGEGIENAIHLLPSLIPVALVGALVWFVIAWFANQGIIDAATGARRVDRKAEPRLYNLIENLCISRGLTVPAIRIIETDQRNAFASGIREGRYSITVTRGLMNALDDAELEAVLAHELTHIQNRDVQLLVISAVFVGIISLVGDLLIRAPRMLFWGSSGSSSPDTSSSSGGGFGWGGGSRSRGSSSNSKGGGGAIILILIAVAIFIIARLLATPVFIVPPVATIPLLFSAGLTGGLGQILFLAAMRAAPANRFAPAQYSQIFWAVFFGAIFYDEFPDGLAFGGIALIALAGFFTLLREDKVTSWPRRTMLTRDPL